MKLKFEKKYIYFGITAFLVIAASICFYYLLFHWDRFSARIDSIVKIASPVLYGMILAYLLTPLVNTLERKFLIPAFTRKSKISSKKKKGIRFISITLTIIIVIFVVYGFFSIMIPNLINSIQSISMALPIYVNNLMKFMDKYFEANPDIENLVQQLMTTYSTEFNHYVNSNVLPQMESLLRTVSLSLIGVLKAMWNLIIGLIISIYVLFSKETFSAQTKKIIYSIFPTSNANELIHDMRFVSDTFIGFISGKIVDSIIIGLLCFIGTTLLNIPYALLVSVIVGVTNVIPFFGPYLGAIPSALLVLMISPMKCLTFLIFILILQQLDGNFIGPKILGQSTGLTGFWVIFSITIFGGLFGVLGMIIGVPFFAVVYAFIKRLVEKVLRKRELSVKTTDYINLNYIDESRNMIPKDESLEKPFFKFSFKKKSTHDNNSDKKED